MFRYPTYICIYDKVSVYYLDPLNFRYFLLINKSVLCYEIFKKWPLLSLFPDCIWRKHPLFHLTIILEPYNSCSGLFPFRHTTLSYYVRLFNIHLYPSECKYSLIKSFTIPQCITNIIIINCPRSQFCTC